jgi:hypothetical protein
MPATWTPDTIEGSQLEVEMAQGRCVRTGIMDGVDTTDDPYQLLFEVINQLVNRGITLNPPSPLSQYQPFMLLRRVRVLGIADRSARVALFYETPEFGTPTAYLLRHSTVLTSYQTDLLPGTRIPLRIKDAYDLITDGGISTGFKIPGDNVLFTFLKPLESIQVYALTYGQPKDSRASVGKVNNNDWQGKAKAMWLLSEWTTDQYKYSGYYTLNAAAISRVDEDWSESGILINRQTGKKIHVQDENTTAQAMMAQPYSFGIIYNNNGMMRVGPYGMTDFLALFGF